METNSVPGESENNGLVFHLLTFVSASLAILILILYFAAPVSVYAMAEGQGF
jgi:hypothetical protein